MISLNASMRLDEVRCILEEISTAYCGVLASAHDSVVDAKGLHPWKNRDELAAIAARGRRSIERLDTRDMPEIEGALRATHRRQVTEIRDLFSKMTAENESTLAALRDALTSLTARDSADTGRAAAEVAKMRKLVEMDDLARIKYGIRESADRLTDFIDAIQRDKNTVILMLRDEIRTLQRSLEQIRSGGSGVLSRSQFEACLQRAIASKVSFCAIHVSIRNRSHIERMSGTGVAEQAVRSFAAALQKTLAPGSVMGMWDETEMCALVVVGYPDAIKKTREIGLLLEHSETSPVSVPLKAQLVTVPFNAEEGPEKLAHRLQKLMAG